MTAGCASLARMSESVPYLPLSAAAAAPPDAGAGEFRLHPGAVRAWRWLGAGIVLALSLPAVVASLFSTWHRLVLVALVVALVVRVMHRYVGRYGEGFRCRLGRDGLLVERGVWWRSETFVPRARVQHTDIEQGPLGRRVGTATLKVFTAGSHVGEIGIRGLALADAVTLRDNLLARDGRDAL